VQYSRISTWKLVGDHIGFLQSFSQMRNPPHSRPTVCLTLAHIGPSSQSTDQKFFGDVVKRRRECCKFPQKHAERVDVTRRREDITRRRFNSTWASQDLWSGPAQRLWNCTRLFSTYNNRENHALYRIPYCSNSHARKSRFVVWDTMPNFLKLSKNH